MYLHNSQVSVFLGPGIIEGITVVSRTVCVSA